MFFGITGFEIRYQLRNPVFWVAVAIFFLMGFGITASENVRIGTPGAVHENAPYAIAVATAALTQFYLFVITAFVANAIVRDESSGFAPIVRATPVTSRQIVLGRFLGGFVVALIGYLAVPIGMWAGSVMPWVDPETIGPQVLSYYLWPFLVFAIPNIFLSSALLFGLATRLRSMMAAYIGTVALVIGYIVVTSIVGQKIEYRETLAHWEPLGFGALSEATRYWTQSEMNSKLIELGGTLLFNRLFAVALGALFLGFTVWTFTMTERAPSKWRLKRLARRQEREAAVAATAPALGGGSVVARDVRPSHWVQFLARLRIEVRQVLTSPGLIVLTLFGIGLSGVLLWFGQSIYGTTEHPTVSATMTAIGRGGFNLTLLLVATFYGGELVWRERDRNLSEIIDSTPVPSWVMTVPKIVAIFVVLLIVNVAGMLTGVFYELVSGAHELGLLSYLTWFILPAAIQGLLIAVLSVFVQVLSPNKFVGWAIIFVWFVASIFASNMGYSDPLYRYGSGPSVPLSDFVGQGSFWIGSAVFQFYWLCFAVILVAIAHMLWPRGTDLSLRVRLGRMRRYASATAFAIVAIAAVAMAATGAYGYYNIKVLNRYQTSDDLEKFQADYERKYLKYEKLPMPAVTRVTMNVQLFPKQRRLIATGRYDLQNKTNAPISEVHVRRDSDLKFLALAVAGAKLVMDDPKFGYRIYRFDTPLAPGATSVLTFKSQIWHRGFKAGTPDTDVIENGTFVNNFGFAPIIGMDRNGLLQDRAKRRRQHLPPDLRPAKLEDMSATARNYIHTDWVMSDITLSTEADQTPIAPGDRVSDVTSGGRRTARFLSPAPILNFFSIQSARYKIATREHNGIKLSVYYHPGHDWNVGKMLNAMGMALDYYRAHFGPYQFNYARIIEFPGYSSFAQAFAGTMPYSESLGFNSNTDDPDKIDFTTYVVSHEMAHQYWAHQVVGADMQGSTISSETLAQYSALMVMKHLYGPDKIRRFLKYELDNYLSSRANEVVEELPLERVENQPYIHYRKGAVAMYLLQERLGEDAVDRALARFDAKFRFKGAPYLRSVDLINEFRKEAKTPEQQQLITDLFEKITLYDLKVKEATTRKSGDGWDTTLTIDADKYYANGKGVETKSTLDEPIEVGLFTARPGLGAFSSKNVIAFGQKPIHSGEQRITIHTKLKPTFAGIDPYNYYVDRNSEDNVKDVTAS